MSNRKTFISSVAFVGNGVVNFGGASIRSVLPKSGKPFGAVLFLTNPLAEKDEESMFVKMNDLNDEVLAKVGVPVLDGSAIVVSMEIKIVFSAWSGKSYKEIASYAAPEPSEVERLVKAAKEVEAKRLASSSKEKLKEASKFFIPASDKPVI